MLKVGRYTAAVLLVTVGVMLLLDQTTGSEHLALLLDWWPLLLILLGTEYLIFNFAYRKGERQVRLDLSGLFISVLISAAVVGTTQADRIPSKWLQDLNFNIDTLKMSFSTESGYSFEKETVRIPLDPAAGKVRIENPNGTLDLKSGPVSDIEVQAVIWVDKVNEDKARTVADRSEVRYTTGETVRITAEGYEYTGGFSNKRKPRMNLTVTVPADKRTDYEVELKNGKITVNGVKVKEELKLHTTNGAVLATGIGGSISVGTTNGTVEVSEVEGSADMDTTNGAVTAKGVAGSLKIDTTNGAVTIENAGGAVDVDTTNGRVTVVEARGRVKADATNGSISVATHTVGGEYDLGNNNGSIELKLPSTADVEIKGSAGGSVSTDLPLTVAGKKISGKLNNGQYVLKLDTNGRLDVNRMD